MLVISLVLALVLAWPTFGLSLLAWLAFAFLTAKGSGMARDSLDERIVQFKKRYFTGESQAAFIRILAGDQDDYALNVLNGDEMMTLGNIMIRYIVMHPDVLQRFEGIVARYERMPSFGPRPPYGYAVQAIVIERKMTHEMGGSLHLLCYKAIETLRDNNPNHTLLRKLDEDQIRDSRGVIEMAMEHEWEMGRSPYRPD